MNSLNRFVAAAAIILGLAFPVLAFAQTALLNVSYDPTRELYTDFNNAFARFWQKKTGEKGGCRPDSGHE